MVIDTIDSRIVGRLADGEEDEGRQWSDQTHSTWHMTHVFQSLILNLPSSTPSTTDNFGFQTWNGRRFDGCDCSAQIPATVYDLGHDA